MLSCPAPPQVRPAVQLPQLDTDRTLPQLSVALTVPQLRPSRAQNEPFDSGVQEPGKS